LIRFAVETQPVIQVLNTDLEGGCWAATYRGSFGSNPRHILMPPPLAVEAMIHHPGWQNMLLGRDLPRVVRKRPGADFYHLFEVEAFDPGRGHGD
jgi:hypothetical protein